MTDGCDRMRFLHAHRRGPAEAAHPAPRAGRRAAITRSSWARRASVRTPRCCTTATFQSAIVAARGRGTCPDTTPRANVPLLPRHLRLHELFPGEDWKAPTSVTGRRLVLGNGDVRISYVAAGEASPLYRNATGDECVFVEAGQATSWRRLRRAVGAGGATTSSSPAGRPTAGSRRATGRCARTASRRAAISRRPASIFRLRSIPGDARRTASETCARPTEPHAERRRRRRGATSSIGPPDGDRRHDLQLADASVRRRRLGRLPVPVHAQRRRLRAADRPRASAAARRIRSSRARDSSSAISYPRKVDYHPLSVPVALLPLQCRQRRGDVLLRRRLLGTQGLRDRAGLGLAAPGRHRARPAARSVEAQHRCGRSRRAGRHGRHVPATGDRRGRTQRAGRGLRLELGHS